MKEFNKLPSDPDFKNLKDTQLFWLQMNISQDYKEEKAAFKQKDDMKSMKEEDEEDISNEEFISMMGERHKMDKSNDK